MKGKTKARSHDEYLAGLTEEKRIALERLKRDILAVVPNAKECISYGLPAFMFEGKVLVAFGATQKHCAFYPMSGTMVEAFKEELEEFDTSKGTIRFQENNPLSAKLVRKLVKARIEENAAQQQTVSEKKKRN